MATPSDEAARRADATQAAILAALVAAYFQQVMKPGDVAASGAVFLQLVTSLVATQRAEFTKRALVRINQNRAAEFPELREILLLGDVDAPQIRDIAPRNGGGVDPAALLAQLRAGRPAAEALAELERARDAAARPVRQITIPRGNTAANRDQIRQSLISTGPAELLKLLQGGKSPDEAMKRAATTASGAAVRLALDGARETTLTVVRHDDRIIGYQRVPKGLDSCSFCLMLASRGPVYLDDSFDLSDPRFQGDGTVKVHDFCGCALQEVYSRQPLSGINKVASDLWAELARGSGQERYRSFRRGIDAMRRERATLDASAESRDAA